jgi:hypothetical protein
VKAGKVLIIIGFILFLTPFIIIPILAFNPGMQAMMDVTCVFGLAAAGFGLIFIGALMSGGSQWGSGWGAPGPRPLPYQPYQYAGGQQSYEPPPQPGPPAGPQGQYGGYLPPPEAPGYQVPPPRPMRPESPARPVDRPGYDGSGTAPGDVKQLTISGLGLQCPQCGGPSKEVGHWGWRRCDQCGHKFK